MSDPEQNLPTQHSTLQKQAESEPVEQQSDIQLFYNEETHEWYDSFGRVYKQQIQQPQEPEIEPLYDQNAQNYQSEILQQQPINTQVAQPIPQSNSQGGNQQQVLQNSEQILQESVDVGENQPIEPEQVQKNQDHDEKKEYQIQIQREPERQPICSGLPQSKQDDQIDNQEPIQSLQAKQPLEETEVIQANTITQDQTQAQNQEQKQEKQKEAALALEKQQEEKKEKERQKERQIQREKEREREREREAQRQKERQRQKQRQIQRQKERQFIKEKERLIEKQEKLQQQKEKLRQQEKEQQERYKEQYLQEKGIPQSESPEKSEGRDKQGKKDDKKEKKQKKQKKQKKSKKEKEKENKDKPNDNPVSSGNKQPNIQPQARSLSDSSARVESPPNVPESVVVPPPLVPQPQVVEIQPIMIIREAQKQRIESTLNMFAVYMGKHTVHIGNQKSVYINMTEEIDRKKGAKYVWYHCIKEYLSQYQSLTRIFHENSYKQKKEDKISNTNIYLNIAEELKTGTDELLFLKKQTGNNYNRFHDYIGSKINIEMQITFNKFIAQLNKAQQDCSQKKKRCMALQDQFRKTVQRLTKIYNRGKMGKQQQEDVFVETCKFIQIEREFRQSLVLWGKGVIELRKIFIGLDLRLCEEIQMVLNIFKNAEANIYGFHPQKFETIINSKEEIIKQMKYSRLGGMADADYVKYALQLLKMPVTEIGDRDFEYFVEMPHFEVVTGKSSDLLKGMVNKSFQLRQKNEELINTISGNLVHFSRHNSEYKDKFIIKNLMANIVAEGVIQFDQVLPGIIFNNNRTIRLNFKDQDRAEELICLLNEKI